MPSAKARRSSGSKKAPESLPQGVTDIAEPSSFMHHYQSVVIDGVLGIRLETHRVTVPDRGDIAADHVPQVGDFHHVIAKIGVFREYRHQRKAVAWQPRSRIAQQGNVGMVEGGGQAMLGEVFREVLPIPRRHPAHQRFEHALPCFRLIQREGRKTPEAGILRRREIRGAPQIAEHGPPFGKPANFRHNAARACLRQLVGGLPRQEQVFGFNDVLQRGHAKTATGRRPADSVRDGGGHLPANYEAS